MCILEENKKEHQLDILSKENSTSKQSVAAEKEKETELAVILRQINTGIEHLES